MTPNHELENQDICPSCEAGVLVLLSDQSTMRECSECGCMETDDWDYPYLTELDRAFLSGE